MRLLCKASACSVSSVTGRNSAQGSLPGSCGSRMSCQVPPSSLPTLQISTTASGVCSPAWHSGGPAGRAAVGTGWLAVPLPCLSFVSEQEEHEVALAECWGGGIKSCWRCGAAEVRCDSVTCHSWLLGGGETQLGQEEMYLKNWTLHRKNSLFTSGTNVSIFTANPGTAVRSTKHERCPWFCWLSLISRIRFHLLQTCCCFAAFSLYSPNLSLLPALNFPALDPFISFYAEVKVPYGQRCLFVCYNLFTVRESCSYIKH